MDDVVSSDIEEELVGGELDMVKLVDVEVVSSETTISEAKLQSKVCVYILFPAGGHKYF